METWNAKLQCCWSHWSVVADGWLQLEMPPGNCCDMSGCIEIAKSIMPEVTRISTIQGERQDTEYILLKGEWVAYDMRQHKRRAGDR